MPSINKSDSSNLPIHIVVLLLGFIFGSACFIMGMIYQLETSFL